MNKVKIVIVIFCFLAQSAFAQTGSPQPCSSPEVSQFNFWIGNWDLTWNDTVHATNRIEKIFGNCTLQENFNWPGSNFQGRSWTVFNVNYKIWEQTWIDNNGGYTSVSGGVAGDSVILTTREKNVPRNISPTGKMINRMVYFKIKPDSFDWDWESSTDGGVSWKSNWLIHYKRKG